jgi:hypothetical protein
LVVSTPSPESLDQRKTSGRVAPTQRVKPGMINRKWRSAFLGELKRS